MSPGRWRLFSLLAFVIPVGLTAAATPVNPGFSALALASAAAGAALLLAGRLFRVIIAVLIALLGLCTVLVALVVTPVVGTEGLLPLAFVGGAFEILIGIGIAATASRWPGATRRYSRTRVVGEDDPIGDWDALSAGDDPTEPGDPAR